MKFFYVDVFAGQINPVYIRGQSISPDVRIFTSSDWLHLIGVF